MRPLDPWLPANATTTSGNNAEAFCRHGRHQRGIAERYPARGPVGPRPQLHVQPRDRPTRHTRSVGRPPRSMRSSSSLVARLVVRFGVHRGDAQCAAGQLRPWWRRQRPAARAGTGWREHWQSQQCQHGDTGRWRAAADADVLVVGAHDDVARRTQWTAGQRGDRLRTPRNFDLQGDLAIPTDTTAPFDDACQRITSNVAGKMF